jgi:hypothetical protein
MIIFSTPLFSHWSIPLSTGFPYHYTTWLRERGAGRGVALPPLGFTGRELLGTDFLVACATSEHMPFLTLNEERRLFF